MEYNNLILVTWDFTDKSVMALEHAINIAKTLQHDVAIIHIVKSNSEKENARREIENSIKQKFININVKPNIYVEVGDIFNTIAEKAEELKARIVVMGTHGIRGMQKLFGSWALKVIAKSKSPFVVVQDYPKKETFSKIVIPVTFRKENKEIVNWASYFSRHFGIFYHIYYPTYSDANFIRNTESNLLFISKIFKQKNVPFEITSAGTSSNFHEKVVEYAKEIEADAIMLMTTRNLVLTDFIFGAEEQHIIANEEKIPVICINPKPAKIGGSFSTSGG